MANKFSLKTLKVSYSNMLLILVSIFYITKIYRAFSGSTNVGGIWVFIQIFFVALGLLLMIKKYKTAFKNGAVATLSLYTAISMINSLFSIDLTVKSLFSYVMIPYAVCVLMIFLTDGEHRDIEDNKLLVATFYIISAFYLFSMLNSGSYSTAIGAVSDAYYIIGLLPIMLVLNKRRPYIPIFFAGFVIIISGKRAGMIAFALMVISYYVIEAIRTKRHKDFAISFFSLLFIILIVYVAFVVINQNFNSKLLMRLLKLQQDGGSGRSDRWIYILKQFENSSLFNTIFGHGDAAVSKLLPEYAGHTGHAHNDFIELLYNYGIFSVICYIFFYIYLIIEFINMIRKKYEYAAHFLMAIICSLNIALFSYYVIDPTYITSGMICFGYLISDFKKKEKLKLIENTK